MKPISLPIFLAALAITALPLLPARAEDPKPAKDVDVPSAAKLLADTPEITILDIRTPEEFAEGHIAGAVNIDFKAPTFADKIAALDKAKPYLVHCRSGSRSAASMEQFQKLGFQSIYHLTTGINGWLDAKKPVEK